MRSQVSTQRPLQRRLTRFFDKPQVEIAVAALVLLSVVLTLLEFALAPDPRAPSTNAVLWLMISNDLITFVFVIELTLRYFAVRSPKRFFREYWIDILAVLPLFRVFRSVRVIRLFRLIRLLRMFGVASRLSLHFPEIMRRGVVEYVFVCGLLALTVVFGTAALTFFESGTVAGQQQFSVVESFWFSVYSLFAGEPVPGPPQTLGGKLVAVAVMFMGLTIFAMFTGTVSAFMVERLQAEGKPVDWEQFEDHVIICGWNSKTEIIVKEFLASPLSHETDIVLIAQIEPEQLDLPASVRKHVCLLVDDFTRVSALERAGVHRARTCIIMADTTGGRSHQDADARTILAALTVEKLNQEVYTCAELMNRSYGTHLKMGNVNDFVVSGEYGAYLLAQAAMNRGLMGVFSELLTYQRGNDFYRVPVPDKWYEQTFFELFVALKQEHNAIAVGVANETGTLQVNPREYRLQPGDELVVIAEEEVRLD